MRIDIALIACLGLLAGCAGTGTGPSCEGVDWYRLGYQDAERTWYSRVEEHTARCEAQGVRINATQYQRGWAEGRFASSNRTDGRLP